MNAIAVELDAPDIRPHQKSNTGTDFIHTFESGKPASLTFTATKAGTYEFRCANFCGMGHGKMKGQIIVSP